MNNINGEVNFTSYTHFIQTARKMVNLELAGFPSNEILSVFSNGSARYTSFCSMLKFACNVKSRRIVHNV
jgi:hypothetical protein